MCVRARPRLAWPPHPCDRCVSPGGVSPRGGAAKARNKRLPPPQGRRRGQGVITGLAARRPAAVLRRAALNRAAFTQVHAGIDPSQTGVSGGQTGRHVLVVLFPVHAPFKLGIDQLKSTGMLQHVDGNEEAGCVTPDLNVGFQKMKQRTKPFVQPDGQYRRMEAQRRSYRQPEQLRGQNPTALRRPFRLQRR